MTTPRPRSPERLVPVARDGLPGWCDRLLSDPAAGEFFASRTWYDTLLAHGLPAGAAPCLAVDGAGAVALPLLSRGTTLTGLVSPYTLDWRPLAGPATDAEAMRAAGRDVGRAFRFRAPIRLDTLDPAAPGLDGLLAGLAGAGLRPLRFLHTGNWHEVLPPGTGWDGYLTARAPALRNTIARKLARAARETVCEVLRRPGPELAAGIAAYEAVRALSWKPGEPFPAFDAALMRAAAAAGVLRLGVLRDRAGQAVAAQYWIVDRGGRRATVLKLAHAEAGRAGSPGTVLTASMIRLLLSEGVTELDFGRGDDAYKRLWVATRRQRIGLVLASPLHPGGWVALLRQAAGGWRRHARRS